MSLPLGIGCLWVLAATVTALLPMRMQFAPGITLLVAAPILLIWIGYEHGFWTALLGLLAFMSMFRRPLAYLAKRALGRV